MDERFLVISDLGQSGRAVQEAAERRGATHVVLIDQAQPRAVLQVGILSSDASAIGQLIEVGDLLEPAPPDIELGAGLTSSGMYLGDEFAVDMELYTPGVLFAETPGHHHLLRALRDNSFMLVMADSELPGPADPISPDPVLMTCPIGPHGVLVAPERTTCPEHGAELSP